MTIDSVNTVSIVDRPYLVVTRPAGTVLVLVEAADVPDPAQSDAAVQTHLTQVQHSAPVSALEIPCFKGTLTLSKKDCLYIVAIFCLSNSASVTK